MNFGRVVRMAIRYKFTFAASIASALLVAVFWGANIGTVYPVVEVVFKDKSMHQWIDGKIDESRSAVASKSAEVERLREQLAVAGKCGRHTSGRQRELQWELAKSESELAAATSGLNRYQAIKPYINRYLPDTPFHTLVLVTAILLVGTVIKDVFLVINNVLVARLAQRAVFDLRKLFYRRTLRMDLATFGEDGTADLMSRFTNDVSQVAGGLDSLFGKLVREPLKMVACLAGAAMHLLAVALAHPDRHAGGGLLGPLAGEDAQAGQPPGDGRNGPDLRHPRRNLPQHQDRQGLHQRAAGAQAVPPEQQAVLSQGDGHRPLRFAQPSDDRSAGHRDDLAGDDRRRLADLLAADHALRHPA